MVEELGGVEVEAGGAETEVHEIVSTIKLIHFLAKKVA